MIYGVSMSPRFVSRAGAPLVAVLAQFFAVGELFVLRSTHRSDGEIQTGSERKAIVNENNVQAMQDRRCYQPCATCSTTQAHRAITAAYSDKCPYGFWGSLATWVSVRRKKSSRSPTQ